ncbi:MAG: DUF4476 domain-containing protein [Bacteroidota bacterium]|nr:DUF4476 domain-containing protein [Bacteroidota bacterium]
MKKALLLALAALLAAAAPALAYPPAPANVNFTSERGLPFSLVLDGRPLTRGVARQVHVDQLVPGQHWADFSVPTAYGGALRFRRRVWLEPGVETSFVLVARPGWPLDLREISAVSLYGPRGGHGYPGSYGYGNGGAYNSPQPYGTSPPYPNSGYPGNNGNGNGPNGNYPGNNGNGSGYPNNGGNSYPGNNSDNGSYPGNNGSNGSYPNNGSNGYPNNGNGSHAPNAPGYPGSGGGYYPGTATSSYRTLPAPEVSNLVQSVQHERFDDNKLRTAKQGLAQSAVSADDLKRLLQALDFEPSRVDLAKFGYAHLTDPDNFERALDGLQFETSRQEVEEALSSTPQN